MPSAPLVEVLGFVKRYGRRIAVDGADLILHPGEIHGLIGPDGCGKSSLMKAVAGVLKFDAGEVNVFGTSLSSEHAAESVKGRIGFMPQGLGLNLYPDLTVEENLDFFARLRLLEEEALSRRKETLLAMTRLERFRQRPTRHLSGGMKQKLGLICTLIHEPQLLILDEPTTGVDPVSRRDFWEIFGELLRERGSTALISTAYLDEASRFDRVTLLHAGKVTATGEPTQVAGQAQGTVVSFSVADQVGALEALQRAFPHTQALGSTLRVFVPDPSAELAVRRITEVLPDLDLRTFATSAPELEDAFVARIQPASRAITVWGAPRGEATFGSWPAEQPAIEAVGLTKTFGSFAAVSDVSFAVPSGQIFGLLGANGAGKTTVIKMLTGILAPTRGTGRVAGIDMGTASAAIREHIGYMSQSFSLYTELTVLENLRLYAGVYGLDRRTSAERVNWVVHTAGLEGHQGDRAEGLPMGMRQRLALGCALIHQPRVVFLDEPTAGVDVVGRRQLWETIFRLSRSLDVAILVTTHYMSEAEHCDRLALMHAGRIVANASPGELKHALETELGGVMEVSVDDPHRALAVIRALYPSASPFGRHIHLHSKHPEEDAARVHSSLRSAELRCEGTKLLPVSMEDVFIARITELEAAEMGAVRGTRAAAVAS